MPLTTRIQNNGTGAFAVIKDERHDLSVLLLPGMQPDESLSKTAAEMRQKANRLQNTAALLEAARDLL